MSIFEFENNRERSRRRALAEPLFRLNARMDGAREKRAR
jgi:hypothetical protein